MILSGKTVEVIAFEIEQSSVADGFVEETDRQKRRIEIEQALGKYRVDISSFKFNRDKANDYE
jgi:hypothetical protein